MAAPVSTSVTVNSTNSFVGDHTQGSCVDDPNFATICSFIQNFGEIVRIGHVPFDDLQLMLENTNDVPLPLVQLHITLLRRVFKTVSVDKWEKSLAKFGHTYCSQDAWEIERFGYKKAKITTKLRLLKNLLEAQFDYNVKFKSEVNKLQAADLRLAPLGRDTEGQVYWYQVDADANLRVYREDIDDETWEIVASSRDELGNLISQLQRGEVRKPEPDETILVPEDDNGKDIEPKEIILDTGKVDESGSNTEDSDEDSDEDDEDLNKDEVKTVKPLIIKHDKISDYVKTKVTSEKVEGMDVDHVKKPKHEIYEVNSVSSNNTSGLKLVFGVKSKPKAESVLPKQEVSTSEHDSKQVSEFSCKVEENITKAPEPPVVISPPESKKESTRLALDNVSEDRTAETKVEQVSVDNVQVSELNQTSVKNTISVSVISNDKVKENLVTPDKNKEISTSSTEENFTAKVNTSSKKQKDVLKNLSKSKFDIKEPNTASVKNISSLSTLRLVTLKDSNQTGTEELKIPIDNLPTLDVTAEREPATAENKTSQKQIQQQDNTNNSQSQISSQQIVNDKCDKTVVGPMEVANVAVVSSPISVKPTHHDLTPDTKRRVSDVKQSQNKVCSKKSDKPSCLPPNSTLPDTSSCSSKIQTSVKRFESVQEVQESPVDLVKKFVPDNTSHWKTQELKQLPKPVSDITSKVSPLDSLKSKVKSTKERFNICRKNEKIDTGERDVRENIKSNNEKLASTESAEKTNISNENVSINPVHKLKSPDKCDKELAIKPDPDSVVVPIKVDSLPEDNVKAIVKLESEATVSESDLISQVPAVPCHAEVVAIANIVPLQSEKFVSPPKAVSPGGITDVAKVDSVKIPPIAPVREDVLKKETWVCGTEELKPVEETVTKVQAWVCGENASISNSNEIETKPIEKNSNETNASSDPKSDLSIKMEEKVSDQSDVSPAKGNSSLVLYSESSEDSDISESASNSIPVASIDKNCSDMSDKVSPSEPTSKLETVESSNICKLSGKVGNHSPFDLQSNKFNESDNVSKVDGDVSANDLKREKPATKTKNDYNPDLKPDVFFENKGESFQSKIIPDSSSVSSGNTNTNDSNPKGTPSDIIIKESSNPKTTNPEIISSVSLFESTAMEHSTDTPKLLDEHARPGIVSISSTIDPKLEPEMHGKRKAEENLEPSSKFPRLELPDKSVTGVLQSDCAIINPIVGETIQEEVMTITGEGSGALNEGSNENSPAALAADIAISQDESAESEEESRDAFPSRGRGVRRGGRGRRGRPALIPGSGGRVKNSDSPRNANKGLREVARLGVALDTVEVNGDNDRPVRASRRIAQIRLKEEEERRKLEEERLAQLKAAQMKKKAKQDEQPSDINNAQKPVGLKGKKGRKFLKDQIAVADYVPSESESDKSEEDEGSDEFSGKGKGKRRKKRKNGKAKKGGNPWATSSDDDGEEEAVEEEEEEYHYEEEEELVFKSDHEFSPESDLEGDGDVGPSRHARTAKQDKGDLFEEGNCCKCGKGDHPEWILLCDKCDKGWHASCLRPQLWVVPEGEWFCPPCQHNMLIDNLNKNLIEYEGLLKRRENEILRKQRLAYVGISLNNVLPEKDKPEEVENEHVEKHSTERKKPRRRILSDEEELSEGFINDDDSDNVSRSRTYSSQDSEDEPVYRLRARRTKKAFDFKEYDDMINSALRVDDDEGEVENGEHEELDENEEDKVDGEEEPEDEEHGGKNEAFLKHLEEQAKQEEEETDEELLDEKERLRRRELKKISKSNRKTRRRINDLDEYSDEDSDDDFKASEAEDEEELGDEGESEWSGDKMEEDSDDSIAKRARRKDRHGRLGRREKYSDKGLVRRSTRKRRSRISYDESDEDEEEEDQTDKWQSGDDETEVSESNSDSEDSTWGKRKKKGFVAKSKTPNFVLGAITSPKSKGKSGVKRKKRKTDEDDVDRAWNNSARGSKNKDEPIERRTRGRKINFKDILDSGESDDEGNVRPKRRPLSDSEDSRSPSSSRRLAEEIRAENARQAKEYEANKAKKTDTSPSGQENSPVSSPPMIDEKEIVKALLVVPEALTVAKLLENNTSSLPKLAAESPVSQSSVARSASPVSSPVVSPLNSVPPSSSPISLITAHVGSPLAASLPVTAVSLVVPSAASPKGSKAIFTSSLISPVIPTVISPSTPPPPLVLPKSPPHPLAFPPTPLSLSTSAQKSASPIPIPIPPPVPVTTSERKSKSKGSRSSRGSKSEKMVPSELELAFSKPVKAPPLPPALAKSLSKKREAAAVSLSVPNPNLLIPGGVLPELLSQGIGIPVQLRGIPPPSTGGNIPSPSSKKSSSGSSSKSSSSRSQNSPQRTPPPPISQNLSPSVPLDIDRVPNPALLQGPGIRPFHPMWVRNPAPPPSAYGSAGIAGVLGKPPPLNTSPFPGQQGPSSRSTYPSPPPLRIPNPNTSPLQAFQHFKRENPIGGPLYRLPPGQPPTGVPLSNLLPPGMLPPHGAGPERFFGAAAAVAAAAAYGHPYGLLASHVQSQHSQPMFPSPYDYRPPETAFKDEPAPSRNTSSGSLPTSMSNTSSPPPPVSGPVPSITKEEMSAARDSEFGGLVSYFSSQRDEEDMDT